MKTSKTKLQRVDNGGFRIAWFIPVECIMFGMMLALGPKFINVVALCLSIMFLAIFALIFAYLYVEHYQYGLKSFVNNQKLAIRNQVKTSHNFKHQLQKSLKKSRKISHVQLKKQAI